MGWNEAIKTVLGHERQMLARFLELLGKVDAAKEYAELGYSSLNEYCLKELGLCEHETWPRICAARVAARFPRLLELIAEGRVTLTAVRLIAPILLDSGDAALLERICGKTTREVDRIAAGIRPRKECPEKVTIGTRVVEPGALAFGFGATNTETGTVRKKPTKSAKVTYITPVRVKVEFSAREELVEKLERAKVVAKAQSVEDVLEKALEEYLEHHDPARKAARNVGKAVKKVPATNKRSFPNSIKHAALMKSGNRCEAIGSGGRRCTATDYLEFDHVRPFAMGGRSTLENCRVLCQTHNRLAAEKSYGRDVMDRFRRGHKHGP